MNAKGMNIDVGGWLRSLGLERYEPAFRENEIDQRVLPSLTQEDLKEIGVGPVGHRRWLLDAIVARHGSAIRHAQPCHRARLLESPCRDRETRGFGD